MRTRSWIRHLFARPVIRPFRKAPFRARPALEALEERWVLSPIVVTNPTDTPVAGQTDLRQAIAQANATVGPATITFDSTVFATPQTITLTGTPAPTAWRGRGAGRLWRGGPPAPGAGPGTTVPPSAPGGRGDGLLRGTRSAVA